MRNPIHAEKHVAKIWKFSLPFGLALFIFVVSFPLMNMVSIPIAVSGVISSVTALIVWKIFSRPHQHHP